MKILLVNRALGTLFGGGESFDLNAARHFIAQGHNVAIITGKSILSEPRNHFADMNVIYLPVPNLRRYAYKTETFNTKLSAALYHVDNFIFELQVYRWLKHQKRYEKFDIVQCCSLFTLPRWLIYKLALPTVSWLPGPPSRRAQRAILKLIHQPCFGLFTHGAPVWTLNQIGLSEDRQFRIIGPGVDLVRVDQQFYDRVKKRRDLGLTDQTLLGITTARLVPVKNHFLLLEAIAIARKSGVVWHWIIVGDGPLDHALRQQAKNLGLENNIHFTGYQSQNKVHHWLNAADIFALTSSYENFSIATLEAMAHCLPVIGTAVGYLQHLIRDAGAGLVVPEGDAEELAKALVNVSQNIEQGKVWGARGRAFVEQLDWPAIAGKMLIFYEEVSSGRFR